MTANTKKRAYVETYGCQMNISDGELMQGVLEAGGYEIVYSPEEADVVLVNTCAIREHAERRVLGRVGQLYGLKQERPEMVKANLAKPKYGVKKIEDIGSRLMTAITATGIGKVELTALIATE